MFLLFFGIFIFKSNWENSRKINFLNFFYFISVHLIFAFIFIQLIQINTKVTFFNIIILFILISYLIWIFISKIELLKINVIRMEYYIIILMSLTVIILFIQSVNFFYLYCLIEIYNICTYVLIAFSRKSFLSSEAVIKYFTINAIGSILLLFSIIHFYSYYNTLNYFELSYLLNNMVENTSFGVIQIFILYIAIFMKLGMAPFHMWLPDIYQGSINSTMLYIGLITKIPLIVVLFVFNKIIFINSNFVLFFFIFFIGVYSLYISALNALEQINLKRFFAYSGINHFSYVLLGFSCNTIEGYSISFLYMVQYIIISAGFFGCYFILNKNYLNQSNSVNIFSNLSSQYYNEKILKLISILILVYLFSYLGLPPFSGFYFKYYLFLILFNNFTNSGIQIILLLLILFSTVLSSIYYIRIIKLLFFNSKNILFSNINLESYNKILKILKQKKLKQDPLNISFLKKIIYSKNYLDLFKYIKRFQQNKKLSYLNLIFISQTISILFNIFMIILFKSLFLLFQNIIYLF